MSSSFWLLALRSRDLSHAEKEKVSKFTKSQLFLLEMVLGLVFFLMVVDS